MRARTAFPSRRLEEALLRDIARLCYRFWRLPSDEGSVGFGSVHVDEMTEVFSKPVGRSARHVVYDRTVLLDQRFAIDPCLPSLLILQC